MEKQRGCLCYFLKEAALVCVESHCLMWSIPEMRAGTYPSHDEIMQRPVGVLSPAALPNTSSTSLSVPFRRIRPAAARRASPWRADGGRTRSERTPLEVRPARKLPRRCTPHSCIRRSRAAQTPAIDARHASQRLPCLHKLFETLYGPNPPIRVLLETLDTARIIEYRE